MSMFKRMLASVGIGAAKVDLLLHQDVAAPGDTIGGIVRIEGGRVEQQVDDVYAFLMTRYLKEQNDTKIEAEASITKFLLAGAFTVEAEQVYEFPVSISLPACTPVTLGHTPVWIQTGLEIKEAIDPKDQDYLQIKPHPHAASILEAVGQLGFRLRDVTCEHAPYFGKENGVPYVQNFEFVPTMEFQSQLDELEIVFYPDEEGISLLLQIDRKARGLACLFAELKDTDEHFVRIRFEREQLSRGASSVASQLADTIRKHLSAG